MQFDLFGFQQPKPKPKTQVKAVNWVDWVYTPENPRPNYQRISRKYPTAAFHLQNNRLGICRFDAELDREHSDDESKRDCDR